jgi:hypothetical protein
MNWTMQALILGLLWLFLVLHGKANAYPVPVHSAITESVIDQNEDKIGAYLKEALGFPMGIRQEFEGRRMRDWIAYGSEQEDLEFRFYEVAGTAYGHFYNPLSNTGFTSDGQPLWESAYERANNLRNKWSWQMARGKFFEALTSTAQADRDNAFAHVFRALGHLAHLVQDVGVPSHSRNDAHAGLSGLRRLQALKSSYESYTATNRESLDYTMMPFPCKYVSYQNDSLAPKQFWDLEAYQGQLPFLLTCYGLAEYSNANFASDETIFTENSSSLDQRFPYPRRSSAELYEKVVDQMTGKKRRYFRIVQDTEPIDHFAVAGTLYRGGRIPQAVESLSLDENCHKDYVERLLPRAVGYTAGLIDYFFRGKVEIVLPGTGVYALSESLEDGFTEVHLLARNVTPDDQEMPDGSIVLVVKHKVALENPFQSRAVPTDTDFSYIVVPEAGNTRSIPRNGFVELVFKLQETPIPTWGTDVYLQVVYRGRLGSEMDAVGVGFKDVGEPTPIDVFNNMDKICVDNAWYDAGSAEVIAQADRNHDGVPDGDVYPHDLRDIYIRFSPASTPRPASAQEHNLHIPTLGRGAFLRAAYILTDYEFSDGFHATDVAVDPNDHWVSSGFWCREQNGELRCPALSPAKAIKNQTEYVEDREYCCELICGPSDPNCCDLFIFSGCQVRHFPTFTPFRGSQLWKDSWFLVDNWPFPTDSTCSLLLLP